MRTFVIPSLVFAIAALACGSASAAPPVSGAEGKRFRIHADTEFAAMGIFDPDGSTGPIGYGGFGVGRPGVMDGNVITQQPSYGLGFGYMIVPGKGILGARLSMHGNGTIDEAPDDAADVSTTNFGGYFVPYFQWMFLEGNWVRPYVEGRLGFGGGLTRVKGQLPGPMGGGDFEQTGHTISPNVGVGGGAHFFIVDAFSIDLGLNFDFFAPHGRTRGDGVTNDERDWDKTGYLFNFGALAGISIWL